MKRETAHAAVPVVNELEKSCLQLGYGGPDSGCLGFDSEALTPSS